MRISGQKLSLALRILELLALVSSCVQCLGVQLGELGGLGRNSCNLRCAGDGGLTRDEYATGGP